MPKETRLLTPEEFSKPATDEELKKYTSEGMMLLGRQDAKTASLVRGEIARKVDIFLMNHYLVTSGDSYRLNHDDLSKLDRIIKGEEEYPEHF